MRPKINKRLAVVFLLVALSACRAPDETGWRIWAANPVESVGDRTTARAGVGYSLAYDGGDRRRAQLDALQAAQRAEAATKDLASSITALKTEVARLGAKDSPNAGSSDFGWVREVFDSAAAHNIPPIALVLLICWLAWLRFRKQAKSANDQEDK